MTDFQQIIKSWYLANKRDLPWRETKNPYKIWLSEIILQQTRVAQGLSYYEKFIRHYPTVRDLAAASEQEVLADWQGLGYYSRARNLHATAKQIATDFDAVFPTDFKSILKENSQVFNIYSLSEQQQIEKDITNNNNNNNNNDNNNINDNYY